MLTWNVFLKTSLYVSLQVVSDSGDHMRTWLYQMGFPLITVRKESNALICSQKMFLIDPEKPLEQQYPSEYK